MYYYAIPTRKTRLEALRAPAIRGALCCSPVAQFDTSSTLHVSALILLRLPSPIFSFFVYRSVQRRGQVGSTIIGASADFRNPGPNAPGTQPTRHGAERVRRRRREMIVPETTVSVPSADTWLSCRRLIAVPRAERRARPPPTVLTVHDVRILTVITVGQTLSFYTISS